MTCVCQDGKVQALVNHGGDCSWEMTTCSRCGGSGVVTQEQIEREEEGKRIRRARLDARITMADAAKARGMSVVDYSKLEAGRLVQP